MTVCGVWAVKKKKMMSVSVAVLPKNLCFASSSIAACSLSFFAYKYCVFIQVNVHARTHTHMRAAKLQDIGTYSMLAAL